MLLEAYSSDSDPRIPMCSFCSSAVTYTGESGCVSCSQCQTRFCLFCSQKLTPNHFHWTSPFRCPKRRISSSLALYSVAFYRLLAVSSFFLLLLGFLYNAMYTNETPLILRIFICLIQPMLLIVFLIEKKDSKMLVHFLWAIPSAVGIFLHPRAMFVGVTAFGLFLVFTGALAVFILNRR